MPKPSEQDPRPVRWIRVRDKDVGHEFDVAPSAFDPEVHALVKSAAYPDLRGDTAQSRPAKFRTDKAGQPVNTDKEP